jgi:hypothetical protein
VAASVSQGAGAFQAVPGACSAVLEPRYPLAALPVVAVTDRTVASIDLDSAVAGYGPAFAYDLPFTLRVARTAPPLGLPQRSAHSSFGRLQRAGIRLAARDLDCWSVASPGSTDQAQSNRI